MSPIEKSAARVDEICRLMLDDPDGFEKIVKELEGPNWVLVRTSWINESGVIEHINHEFQSDIRD